jgi:protein-S-isoprenylcysteine O-methyltransferase Ste14
MSTSQRSWRPSNGGSRPWSPRVADPPGQAAQPRARITAVLARRRVPLGFVCGVLVLWLAHPTSGTIVPGAAIAIAGEALRIWAAGHLNKSREVTASGPYRWLAHPLYVGSCVMGAGLGVAAGSVIVAIIIAAYLAVTIGAAIASEEAFLRSAFGDRYDRYRHEGEVDRRRPFSAAQALANREFRAAAGLLIAMLVLTLKAMYR